MRTFSPQHKILEAVYGINFQQIEQAGDLGVELADLGVQVADEARDVLGLEREPSAANVTPTDPLAASLTSTAFSRPWRPRLAVPTVLASVRMGNVKFLAHFDS